MPGIDPGTSHMLSERSTIWATSPTISQNIISLYLAHMYNMLIFSSKDTQTH